MGVAPPSLFSVTYSQIASKAPTAAPYAVLSVVRANQEVARLCGLPNDVPRDTSFDSYPSGGYFLTCSTAHQTAAEGAWGLRLFHFISSLNIHPWGPALHTAGTPSGSHLK